MKLRRDDIDNQFLTFVKSALFNFKVLYANDEFEESLIARERNIAEFLSKQFQSLSDAFTIAVL